MWPSTPFQRPFLAEITSHVAAIMNPPSFFFIPRILEREKNKKREEGFLIVAMSNGTR